MTPTGPTGAVLAALLMLAHAGAAAKLPPPTPQEAQAQAAKKAQADAQAAKDKEALIASMDGLSGRWRNRAAANGWKLNAPTPIVAQTAAVTAPAAQSSSSGQPGGVAGAAAQQAPVRSEKAGTAPPSEDIKRSPSQPVGPSPAPVPRRP